MGTAERKLQERQAREALILGEARRMVIREGYLGLNMDRLAEAVNYSKGTIYQHFSAKEDLMLGIVTDGKLVRAELFERALRFDGNPREKMGAVGVADQLFVRLHPEHFEVEHLVRLDSLWEKTSEERQNRLEAAAGCCHRVCEQIIGEAIAHGDLEISSQEAQEMFLLLMAASLGTHLLVTDTLVLGRLGIDDPHVVMRKNYDAYLDGYRWQPLSTEFDYTDTYRRIEEELFGEEFAELERRASAGEVREG